MAMRAALVLAAGLGCAAAAAQADECESMTKSVKVLIDKADPATKGGSNPAALCAAYGEGLGLIGIDLKRVLEGLHSFLDACPGIGGLPTRQHYSGHLGQIRDAQGVCQISVVRIGLRRLFQHGD